MESKRFHMIDNIAFEAVAFTKNLSISTTSGFGYRERIQIERFLFIFLKLILNTHEYDLQGLSNKHYENIRTYALQNKWPNELINVINDVFEFKIYVKDLSSSNAYVRNDALFKVNNDVSTLMPLLANKLSKLITRMEDIYSISKM